MAYRAEQFEFSSGRVLQISEETERSSLILPHYLGVIVFRSMAHDSMIGGRTESGLILPGLDDFQALGINLDIQPPLYTGSISSERSETSEEFVTRTIATGRSIMSEGYDKVFPVTPPRVSPKHRQILGEIGYNLQQKPQDEVQLPAAGRSIGMYL